MGLGSLGSVFGAAPLASAMGSVGWRPVMVYVAIFSFVLAVVAFLVLRDKPSERGLLTPDELAGIVPETKSGDAPVAQAGIGTVLKSPLLWLVFLLSLGGNSHAQCFGGMWEGIYLANVFGFEKPMIGSIMIWYAYGIVVGCFLSGVVVKALGSRKTMFFGLILVALNWIWMMTQVGTISPTELRIFNFFLGGLQMFVISTTFIFCREAFPVSYLGTAMGFLNTFVFYKMHPTTTTKSHIILHILYTPYSFILFICCLSDRIETVFYLIYLPVHLIVYLLIMLLLSYHIHL
jgi:sugar phosphate permease